jgi:hypothetical protein
MNTFVKTDFSLLPTLILTLIWQVKKKKIQKSNIVFIMSNDITSQALSIYDSFVSKQNSTLTIRF